MTLFPPPTPEMAEQRERLAKLIERTRDYKMTPAEIQEQKISFVVGQLPEESKVTREQVAAQIYEREGNLTAMQADIAAARKATADAHDARVKAEKERDALRVALTVYADPCDATETTPCGYKGNMCCKTARATLTGETS